jgi:hypothetical protein
MAEAISQDTYDLIEAVDTAVDAAKTQLNTLAAQMRGKYGFHPREVKLVTDIIDGAVTAAATASQAALDAVEPE